MPSPPLTRLRSLNSDGSPASGSVWVIRHGERIDVVEPEWQLTASRPHDPPLTEHGGRQATATGEHLRELGERVDHIYTSPFLRCVQTAALISKQLGGLPLRVEPGLCEWLNGDWYDANDNPIDAGMRADELKHVVEREGLRIDSSYRPIWDSECRAGRTDQSCAFREVRFPESSEEAVVRYTSTLAHVREQSPYSVLVTHGFGVWTLTEALAGREITEDCGYCSATRASRQRNRRDQQVWTCDVVAQESHLETLEAPSVTAPLGVSLKCS